MSPDRRTRAGDGALTPYGVLWLAYFATIGAYNPYAPLWLQSLGLGTLGIGAMASLQSWTRLLAPYGWSWLADHHGQRSRWLRLAAYGTALGAVGLALWPVAMAWLTPAGPVPAGGDGVRAEGTALAVLVVLVAVMFIANGGIVPLAEAALSQLLTTAAGMDSARYGRVRMWGSLGFILVVAAAGPLLQWWGIAAFPWLLAGLSLALVLAARRVPVAEPADAAAPAGSPGVAEAAGGVEPARSRVDGSAAPDAPDVPDAHAA